MAKTSGRVQVFCIFAFLFSFSFAVQDPLTDPSLEIIRKEDAQEGTIQGYRDIDSRPCRDPTPVNGVLEVVSGIPFRINNITVKLKCLNGLVFQDGTTEKIEHCYAAPTPIKVTGIWSPDQGGLVCQEPKNKANISIESLECMDPRTANNKVKILKGNPNHLYSTLQISCPTGLHFHGGQEVMNVTCLPLPDPCMCKAAWETLDQYLLVYDFNCTAPAQPPADDQSQITHLNTPGSKPVPCYDPTPINGAMEVLSGTPFVISNVTVKIMCLHGLQFPDGTTAKTATCLPASTPYHVTGVWTPAFGPLKCEEKQPSGIHKRFLETLVCMDPKTPDNTVTKIDGDPYHMASKVEVSCIEGQRFPNGLESVNVTCLPLPHPCMCLAAWDNGHQLMYNFNCTGPDIKPDVVTRVEDQQKHEDSAEADTTTQQDDKAVIEEETKLATGYTNEVNSETERIEEKSNEGIEQTNISPNSGASQIREEENNVNEGDTLIPDSKIVESEKIHDQQNQEDEDEKQEEELEPNEDIETHDNKEVIEESSQSLNAQVHPIPQSITSEPEEINEEEHTEEQIENEEDNHEEHENQNNRHQENIEEENEHVDFGPNEIYREENEEKEAPVNAQSLPEEEEISHDEVIPNEIAGEDEEEEAGADHITQKESELENSDEENDPSKNEEHDVKTEEEEKEEEVQEENVLNEEVEEAEEEKGEEAEEEKGEEEEEEKGEEEEEKEEEEEEEDDDDDLKKNDIHEPEEEEWEQPEIVNYHETIMDEENMKQPVVYLDETRPLKGSSITYNSPKESHNDHDEEEEEHVNEDNEEMETNSEDLEHIQQKKEEEEIEEIPEEDLDQEEDIAVTVDEVDAPGPLYEVQQSPFHKIEDDFQSIENEDNPCAQRVDSGYGRNVHSRYFYNLSTQECDIFIYGGSGGNANNFESLEECVKVCSKRVL